MEAMDRQETAATNKNILEATQEWIDDQGWVEEVSGWIIQWQLEEREEVLNLTQRYVRHNSTLPLCLR